MTFEDFLVSNQIRIVFEILPYSVKGFCRKKNDWSVIVLNANMDFEEQKKTFDHELLHVLRGHLYCYDSNQCEEEVSSLIKEQQFIFE